MSITIVIDFDYRNGNIVVGCTRVSVWVPVLVSVFHG